MNKLIFILFSITFVGCNGSEISVEPMRYTKNEISHNCESYFKNDSLFKIVCYDSTRDTILIDNFIDGVLHGQSIEYYNNGRIKNIGYYANGEKNGVWKFYYSTGILKTYAYFVKNKDYNLLYEKKYDDSGSIYSVRYPITAGMDREIYSLGDTARVNVGMLYSEYINPLLIVEFENPTESLMDTIGSYGLTTEYKFEVTKKGTHKVTGILSEFDGDIGFEQGFGGNREFEINYTVE